MATSAPTTGWSSVLPLLAGGPYRYTATPAAGGTILLQWSADNVNWTSFANSPTSVAQTGTVPQSAVALRAMSFKAAGTFAAEYQADATATTARLQALLNAGGEVAFNFQGVFCTNAPLRLPPNTSLHLGANFTIKLIDDANCGIFINQNAYSAGTPLTSVSGWSWGPPASATAKATGIGYLFPVGSYVSIVDTTRTVTNARVQRGYIGIHQVLTSSPDQITFEINDTTPGDGSGVVAGTLYAFPVDKNIKIWGPGTIDGNGVNQTTHAPFYQGDPRLCLTWFRNCKNVTLQDFTVAAGITWTLGSNFIDGYVCTNLRGDTRTGGLVTGDNIHMSGWHNHVRIYGNKMASNDNGVGLTIDITAGTSFDFPYQFPGDTYDVVIRDNVFDCNPTTGSFALIAAYGPAEYLHYSITIDGVSGQGSGIFFMGNYAPTAMTNTSGMKLSIRNCHLLNGADSGATVEFSGAYTWQDIVVEDAFDPNILNEVVKIGGTGVVRHIRVGNAWSMNSFVGTPVTRTGPLITIGAVTVTSLDVEDCRDAVLGANNPAVTFTGAGTVTNMSFSKCSATGSGSSALFALGAGTVTHGPNYFASYYNGALLVG